MLYYLYSSFGNTVEIDEYVGFFEIDDEKYVSRYLEVKKNGVTTKYSRAHLEDEMGFLPEKEFEVEEARKSEYGVLSEISSGLFEAIWAKTACDNSRFFKN